MAASASPTRRWLERPRQLEIPGPADGEVADHARVVPERAGGERRLLVEYIDDTEPHFRPAQPFPSVGIELITDGNIIGQCLLHHVAVLVGATRKLLCEVAGAPERLVNRGRR